MRDRVDVFDAGDLRQHLPARRAHEVLDLGGTCTGERHKHIGEGNVDLRLFLTWRNQHRKHAEQQSCQCQQWGNFRTYEETSNAAGDA